jgi:putative membrane protein
MPLLLLTLGLFTLVINALLLLLTGYLSEAWNLGFSVTGFLPAFLGGIVIGLVSTLLTLTVGRSKD